MRRTRRRKQVHVRHRGRFNRQARRRNHPAWVDMLVQSEARWAAGALRKMQAQVVPPSLVYFAEWGVIRARGKHHENKGWVCTKAGVSRWAIGRMRGQKTGGFNDRQVAVGDTEFFRGKEEVEFAKVDHRPGR